MRSTERIGSLPPLATWIDSTTPRPGSARSAAVPAVVVSDGELDMDAIVAIGPMFVHAPPEDRAF
jgi:hypothetical protein